MLRGGKIEASRPRVWDWWGKRGAHHIQLDQSIKIRKLAKT